ncbi:sensor histidine kinase [Anaerobacillus alkaliphilus]|uniref:histidine kinase n=1 Tax=Anaerobacillus alkaliphilus TaxID=1548597 RepID=A0A4Q0VMN1_9BACI|nr:HAMP domain-containing sensor histidine kinase [Anaerobacillus alkaliphilus]RXI95533.1 sensor histidine kinase [Anaerobacillus alkaliphilus]
MVTIIEMKMFLLNVCFVLLLFFLYHYFIEKKVTKLSEEFFIFIISSFSIIMCMTFTISPTPGYLIDIRQLPFIIGALYGGRRVMVGLFTVIILYRYQVGLDFGFYSTVVIYLVVSAILWIIIPKFSQAMTLKKRLQLTLVTSSIWAVVLIGLFLASGTSLNLKGYAISTLAIVIHFVGIILFVSFIEKVRKERLLINELNKLERLRIVGDIAASISHEVRNPLTVTKGFLQLLRCSDVSSDKKEQYIKLSLDELQRAEEIITDYLTFAKPSLENVVVLELNSEVDYVHKVLAPFAAMSNLTIEVEKSEKVYILAERQKLHQALINLAKNGLEAMAHGGKLLISIEETATHAVIRIIDTGNGMTEEQITRLGTPYYSTKEKGTGLGTMVVYSIIKIFDGQISVKSTVGKGTCFKIVLPKITNETKKAN